MGPADAALSLLTDASARDKHVGKALSEEKKLQGLLRGEGAFSEACVKMGNQSEVRKPADVEGAPSTDAIVRKMAKRALPELQVKRGTRAAKEEAPADDATRRLIRSNFLKAARLRRAPDMPAGTA
jgi:hypothetical protein